VIENYNFTLDEITKSFERQILKYSKFLCSLFILLILCGCSQTSNTNLSHEKKAVPVEIALLSDLQDLKKYENQKIVLNAEFDKIDFDAQPPDVLRAYRLTHFFIKLSQPTVENLFILVPTSNSEINSISSQDNVSLTGTINIENDTVSFFVTEIKKNPFTRK